MFWSPNLTKYSYGWLPLKQHHSTAANSNLLTNILIMIEMETDWDLNLLVLSIERRLSIGVRFGYKILAHNFLNKIIIKINLTLCLSCIGGRFGHKILAHILLYKVINKIILALGSSYPFILPFFKAIHKIHQSKDHSPKIRMNTLK
jgi:hypothetical protein